MNSQTQVAHECPSWALNDHNYSHIYDKTEYWKQNDTLEQLRFHNSLVSSVLKSGDSDWYRVANAYGDYLKVAQEKLTWQCIGDVRITKIAARAAIRFYHRWLYERGAYVAFIEYAIKTLP